MEKKLHYLGYDGLLGLSAEEVIRAWTENGWIEVSPNGWELRLSDAGLEQFAKWELEDALWKRAETDEIKVAKRLKVAEPATNLRKLAQLIGDQMLTEVHDPYLDEKALETLHKLIGLGVKVAKDLRLLTAPKGAKPALCLNSFLSDLNTELKSNWRVRAYSGEAKPHRRYLILNNGAVVTFGLSLNNLNKDEVLDCLPAGNELAEYDQTFFENAWDSAKPL